MTPNRILVKETEWSRKFVIEPKKYLYESKFLADGLEIKADELIARWPTMTSPEHHDFALAFQCKGALSPDDEKMLLFLMRAGDNIVWRTISLMLCRHSNRERAIEFLLSRLHESLEARTNYYQAAELIGDPRFAGVLENHFEEYRRRIDEHRSNIEIMSEREWLEYAQLCRSLWKITARQNYQTEINKLLGHSSELVRANARMHLESE